MYINEMECCGLAELHGIGPASADEILASILEAQGEKKGRVIATSVGAQRSAPSKLEGLNFTKIETFKNPNTGHMVTMWMRSTEMTTDEKQRAEAFLEKEERAEVRSRNRWGY